MTEDYKVGDKVLLHSKGNGTWFPIEPHTVTRVTKNGIVFINDLDVPFKQDGQEVEPGVFKFRFYIEPERKTKCPSTSSDVSAAKSSRESSTQASTKQSGARSARGAKSKRKGRSRASGRRSS